MAGSGVSGLYTIALSYGVVSCVTFSYPGGTVLFSFILDGLKSGS